MLSATYFYGVMLAHQLDQAMVFLDSAAALIAVMAIVVVAWASLQGQRIKKKTTRARQDTGADLGHQSCVAPGRNRIRSLFLGQLLATGAHVPGSHGRADRHAAGKSLETLKKQCQALDKQIAEEGWHWLNNARELSDVASAMARERYQLDFCDPRADVTGGAVINRDFEVLVYTWTARLKSFDHQLDEMEVQYS